MHKNYYTIEWIVFSVRTDTILAHNFSEGFWPAESESAIRNWKKCHLHTAPERFLMVCFFAKSRFFSLHSQANISENMHAIVKIRHALEIWDQIEQFWYKICWIWLGSLEVMLARVKSSKFPWMDQPICFLKKPQKLENYKTYRHD